MNWLTLPREPEPVATSGADELDAYASAAAELGLTDRVLLLLGDADRFMPTEELYVDSVRSSPTAEGLEELLCRSDLADARSSFHEPTHLGFVHDGRGVQPSAAAGPARS